MLLRQSVSGCSDMMVGMRKAADLQWHTTSKEYGRFHDYAKAEKEKKRFQRENDKRCEVLTKDLINCKAQLEVLRLRDPAPPAPEALEHSEKPSLSYLETYTREARYPHSYAGAAKLSSSKYSGQIKVIPVRERACSVQDSISEKGIERVDPMVTEEDVKQLEWILNRLGDKIQPLSRQSIPSRQVENKYNQTSGILDKVLERKNNKGTKAIKNCTVKGDLVRGLAPAHCRYTFYKYYGYAGQGAKTSWGHNLPLGERPPSGKKIIDCKMCNQR